MAVSAYIDHLWVRPASVILCTKLSSPARRCYHRKSSKENGYYIAITPLTESAKTGAANKISCSSAPTYLAYYQMITKEATAIRCKTSHIHYVAAHTISVVTRRTPTAMLIKLRSPRSTSRVS